MADDALKLSTAPATQPIEPPPDAILTSVQITSGTLQMLMAQALNVPLGILTNALLTRMLGPEHFGLFVLVGTVGTWFEIVAVRTLGRTTVKLIANADDWRQTASQFLQIQFLLAMGAGATMFLGAPLIAAALNAPLLVPFLRIAAFELPFAAPFLRSWASVCCSRWQP